MPLIDVHIFANFFVDALHYYSVWRTLCFDLLFLLSYGFRCIDYCRIFTELAESLLEVIVDTPSQVRLCASTGDKGFQTLSSYLPPPPLTLLHSSLHVLRAPMCVCVLMDTFLFVL